VLCILRLVFHAPRTARSFADSGAVGTHSHLARILESPEAALSEGRRSETLHSLQKLSYLAILFVLAPMILATGLTMSPGFDAGFPWLVTLFGGRQSARTLHFICAMAVVLFIVVHLAMVVLAGPVTKFDP